MIYLLAAFAIPPATTTPYCPHRRCDLAYFSSRVECEQKAVSEPVYDKMLFRCLHVNRRNEPF